MHVGLSIDLSACVRAHAQFLKIRCRFIFSIDIGVKKSTSFIHGKLRYTSLFACYFKCNTTKYGKSVDWNCLTHRQQNIGPDINFTSFTGAEHTSRVTEFTWSWGRALWYNRWHGGSGTTRLHVLFCAYYQSTMLEH